MNYYIKTNKEEEKQNANLWDAFVSHLDSIYFPGASESLDSKLVAFEFESYRNSYAH